MNLNICRFLFQNQLLVALPLKSWENKSLIKNIITLIMKIVVKDIQTKKELWIKLNALTYSSFRLFFGQIS